MKRFYPLVLALTGFQIHTALAIQCNNGTIQGTFVGYVEGTASGAPEASLDIQSWDGAGHIQYMKIDSSGTAPTNFYHGTGTYSISTNCVATAYYGGSSYAWSYLVAPNGRGFMWLNAANAGVVSAGRYERVSGQLIVDANATTPGPCGVASLSGTMDYGWTLTVNGIPQASDGRESYDGAGHVVWEENYSDGYSTSTYNGRGTYTITDRCIASVHYALSTNPIAILVAPNGAAYWWLNNHGYGVVSAGKAIRVSRGLVLR